MRGERGELTVRFLGERLGQDLWTYFVRSRVWADVSRVNSGCGDGLQKGLADDGTRATRAMGRDGQQ
jgi:hypothetical protein